MVQDTFDVPLVIQLTDNDSLIADGTGHYGVPLVIQLTDDDSLIADGTGHWCSSGDTVD